MIQKVFTHSVSTARSSILVWQRSLRPLPFTLPFKTSMLTASIKQQAVERINECYAQAEAKLDSRFKRPEVLFNQRGKIAGSARLQTNQIRLNSKLMMDNPETFLEEVIPHEICHLLTYQLHGRVKPHGEEWRYLMQFLFGLAPKARHKMDVSKVEGKTFLYQCGCGPIPLSIRRHNKVVRNQQQYVCRQCRETLVFIGDER